MAARTKKKTAMFNVGFGMRLRKLREARGFTQGELAERVGIELVQISRYERGQALPNAETLVSLAEVLKTDTDVLLRGETSSFRETTKEIDLDLPLLERFQDLQKLSKRDRDAVILLIDSVLTRGDVEQRLKRRTG
jgi:transcriptional regulator with XRE-family HTH domain